MRLDAIRVAHDCLAPIPAEPTPARPEDQGDQGDHAADGPDDHQDDPDRLQVETRDLGADGPSQDRPERSARQRQAAKLGASAQRSFADAADPTGILRLDDDRLGPAPRALAGGDDPADTVLDQAIGRGAISSDDRAAWLPRLRRSPEAVTEVLNSLPGDAALAERAYTEDSRLRSLGDAFDDYMGIREEDGVARDYAVDDDTALGDPTGILGFRR